MHLLPFRLQCGPQITTVPENLTIMRPIDIDPSTYEQQLADKVGHITENFQSFSVPELEVFTSAPINYRMRAEFRVWHEGEDLFHIMFDQQTKEKYRVDHFPPASVLINEVMRELLALLRPNDTARRKLFQIDYLSTLSNQIVVTLVYHRQLDNEWQSVMSGILAELRKSFDIHIIGRARKQKILLDQDYVVESLPVNGKHYAFKQIENSFTQPNAGVNSKMIEWALDVTKDNKGDLLELYCGLGNFSLPMAQNFGKVLATEISKPSVAAAQHNIAINNIDNVTILRLSSEEFVEATKEGKPLRRLEGHALNDYDCKTVLVDPPRAGLDPNTCELVAEFDNIVYISCNPDTLASNLEELTKTHSISRFAMFDQFPYTHHSECGVYLTRKA